MGRLTDHSAAWPRAGRVTRPSRPPTDGPTTDRAPRGAPSVHTGETVGGASHYGVATGPRGVAAGGWQSAFAGTRFPTDVGLAHYSTVGVAGVGHSTAYWSHGYMGTTGAYVRNGFGYYNCFHPAWYTAHPGAWYAAGWAAGAAWTAATWPVAAAYIGVVNEPEYTYDYGSNIVYQNNNVYVGGQDAGTAQQYAQQATDLAVQGQSG